LAALHAAAVARLAELETRASIDGTRLEPLEEDSIRHLAASNDQYDDTLAVRGGDVLERAADRNGIDDLKRIKGIGPAIEKTLNRLGIYRFDQLAALSPAEVNRVAGELRGFHSRIEREDWVGQAGLLIQARDDA
jgi:predicted flap endonuclease-1-like 5' DNA nuclease